MNTREKFAELEEEQDSIVEAVVKSYKQRSKVGIKKYNKTMDRNDLSSLEWLQHLQAINMTKEQSEKKSDDIK